MECKIEWDSEFRRFSYVWTHGGKSSATFISLKSMDDEHYVRKFDHQVMEKLRACARSV